MAIHPDISSLLRESLPEYIKAAEYCLGYKKSDGGCLGYPAAASLLVIADSIGSYHRRNANFSVDIDGMSKKIKSDGVEHFYILNSKYYELSLSFNSIKKVYENFRCILLHNAALAPNYELRMGNPDEPPVIETGGLVHINLEPLFKVSQKAVGLFLNEIPNVVPKSEQGGFIGFKK